MTTRQQVMYIDKCAKVLATQSSEQGRIKEQAHQYGRGGVS